MSENSIETIKLARTSELDSNLKKAIKGTGIIFSGQLIGTIFGLITTMLVARSYSPGDFGLYGLGVLVISVFLRFSSLGLDDGCSRFISCYMGKGDEEKARGTIKSSLIVVSISSTIFAFLLFYLSDFIANEIFGIETLSIVIKIIVISLPFWAIIQLMISIYRGFESVKENVYFSNFTLRFLKVPFFALVIFLGLSFNYIIVFYTLSIIITFLITIIYFIKKPPVPIKKIKNAPFGTRTLLSFSLPILISGLGWYLISGADKIMLGILKTQVEVGLYNAASTFALQLTFFLHTTVFIFQPIAARLLALNSMDELKRNYQILTKWTFNLTFPLMIPLILFPETVISIIFGEKYISAALTLQLLILAYFIHIFLGPNGDTVNIFGKTKIQMYFTFAGGCINIILNYFLIPSFGIEGAAAATMISIIAQNVLASFYLYNISKIHPFQKNFIIPVFLTVAVILTFYYFIIGYYLQDLSILFKIISSIIIILFYFVIIFVSKSYDKEDLQMLLLFERKIGIKFNLLRKIIRT